MMGWMKSKLATIMIAAVAVFTIAGVSAVFAAQGHNTTTSLHTSDGASQQQENQFEAQGMIQQVTFDQGTTQTGWLVFLPSGKQATVTVTFTTTTRITFEGDNSGSSDGKNTSTPQQNVLTAGMQAKVEGTLQADGSVAATEIQARSKNANDNDGNGDNNEQEFVGVIQSVDTTAQTFVLLPDGQTTPVTIAFDSKTNVEDEHDDGDQSGSTSGIVAGAHVQVEAITRSDGSLYAKEVKPASSEDGRGENGGDGDGHNGTPTPTPGTGSGDNGGSGSGGNGGGGNGGSGGSGSGSSGN